MKVGVFDSGIGGLSVVKSLLSHQLFEEIIYYGDTARVPYGSKDKNTIIRYAIEAVEFFKNFDIDMIIVACNSVSAFALEEMREVSDIPVVGVVEAGILATANKLQNKSKTIMILGTKATISSKAYEEGLLKLGFHSFIPKATPLFVPLVEEGIFDGEVLEATLKHYFNNVETPQAIILGCTHFPLIEEKISAFFDNKAIMIHSGEAIVEYLKNNFSFQEEFRDTQLKFFASENPTSLKEVAKKWLQLKK
jgi:glutamate racemase